MIDKESILRREPDRDPQLGRAIREVEGPPASVARLALLRSRIAAAAAAVLESRRERAWWEWTTHWARTEVTLAAAAMLLAAVIGGATTIGRGDLIVDTAVATTSRASVTPLDSVVTRALTVGGTGEQVINAVVGPASNEWLLTAAVVRQ